MKALLMHRERDFDLQQEMPGNECELMQDLELDTLLRAMAGDDAFLFEVARKALLSGQQNDPDTILYRQQIMRLNNYRLKPVGLNNGLKVRIRVDSTTRLLGLHPKIIIDIRLKVMLQILFDHLCELSALRFGQ